MDSYGIDDLLARAGSGDEPAAAELYDRYVERLINLRGVAYRRDSLGESIQRTLFNRPLGVSFAMSGRATTALRAVVICGGYWRQSRSARSSTRSGGILPTRGPSTPSNRSPVTACRRPSLHKRLPASPHLKRPPSWSKRRSWRCVSCPPLQRHVLQLRLQGYGVDATAAEAGCSERTVHRVMKLVRTRLEQRF